MPTKVDDALIWATRTWAEQARMLREIVEDEDVAWEHGETLIEDALRAAFNAGRSGAVTINCDEPAFTVIGRDQLAQATVVHWIERARAAGVAEEKIERATTRYQEIIDFQSANPDRVKRPDEEQNETPIRLLH